MTNNFLIFSSIIPFVISELVLMYTTKYYELINQLHPWGVRGLGGPRAPGCFLEFQTNISMFLSFYHGLRGPTKAPQGPDPPWGPNKVIS